MHSVFHSRRRLGVMALALGSAIAMALSGCSNSSKSNGSPSQDNSGNVTVNFVGPELPSTFAGVIGAFEKANPTIKINYQSVPFDQLNSVLQQRLSAKDPSIDAYTADQSRVPALAARGFLLDLSDLKAQVQQNDLPTQVEASEYNGKLYSLPIWTSEQYLFYNKDALAKAGVADPSIDPTKRMTWDQVEADGKKVQSSGGAKWGLLWDQVDRYYQLQPLPESAGGGSGITGDKLLTPALTTPGWIKAMTWYRDTNAEGLSPRGVAADQMAPTFAAGKSAFFIGGPWSITALVASKSLHWGIAPHPYFAGGKPYTPTDSWSWGVNPASRHQAAAKKFLQFASLTTQGALATIDKVFIVPANKAAFEAYKQKLDASGGASTRGAAELMQYELDHTAVHRPRSIGYTEFEDTMLKTFSDIRNGADPQARLKQAEDQLKRAWAGLQ